MLRHRKARSLDSPTFPEPGLDRLGHLAVKMKSQRFPAGKLINWPVFEKELTVANGARRQRGILTRDFILDVGVPAVGLSSTGNYVLLASSRWWGRNLLAVTAVVVAALPGGEAVGSAVALPAGHPLLSGDVFRPLSDLELQAFFPLAYKRKIRGYESERMPRFAAKPDLDPPFTTTLHLI